MVGIRARLAVRDCFIWLAFCAASTLIPIAAWVAILRHRLYDIDRIIGRTIVYAALTAILAGLYSSGIRAFNWFFVELTGESSDAALVTTLVLATTFTPIKSRLERIAAERLQGPCRADAELDATGAPNPAARVDGTNAPPTLDLRNPQVRAFADAVAAIVLERLEAGRRGSPGAWRPPGRALPGRRAWGPLAGRSGH